ncbi:MAG: ricin-type beta-trefoil lectin domain protein [Actinobacteria bacterium]|nr:ricin-type beta-trefoil lectin domain protein [Actinomycetota bacterium]
MTERPPGQAGDEPAAPELEFARRWRPLIDRVGGDGGQARAAKHLNWTTSTVSRDYKGETLPTEERLFQLASALQLSHREILDLTVLLRRARTARRERIRASRPGLPPSALTSGSPPAAEPPGQAGAPHATEAADADDPAAAGRWAWFRRHRALAVGLPVTAAAAVVAVVLALTWPASPAPARPTAARGQSGPGARGSFPGASMQAVAIPVRSLTPALAAQFREGRTVHAATVAGFVFRNHEAGGLCLTAPDTGPQAGQNHDRVVVSTCHGSPNQVWIPLQWEVDGFRYTHLVSQRYQSMCLNADNLGGLANGRIVQLWNCYPAGNEAWDFGGWHAAVSAGTRSYPLFARDDRLCLDADKWDLRDGTQVRIWTQYPAANQFWS